MSSNEVLNLRELPNSLLVIGGGYIAVEFASILAGLGTQVTLAFRDTQPLRGFDSDLRTRLAQALAARGITLASGVGLQSLEHGGAGFVLHRADGSTLTAAAALNATGRHPNTAGLGLDACGVQLDARGAIAVDADSRSSAPGIWAVGDVTTARQPHAGGHRRGTGVRRQRVRGTPDTRGSPHGGQRRVHRAADRHRRACRKPTRSSWGRWTSTSRTSGR